MKRAVVLDTGPLVALLDRREKLHARAKAAAALLPTPLLTVEPVLTEAMFLLRGSGLSRNVLAMLEGGLLRVALSIEAEARGVHALLVRYANVSMSLADACIVRTVELVPEAAVFTFDSDFTVYRARKNRVIELVEY